MSDDPVTSNFLLRGFGYVYRKVSNFCHIYYRDLRFLITGRQAINIFQTYQTEKTTVKLELEKQVKKHPDKICFIHEDRRWTFKQVNEYSNKVGSVVGSTLCKGDVVVVLLPNCIEYNCIWLGLSQIGVITALVNTNLRLQPLLHCINIVKPKAIIYSNQYDSVLSEILTDIEGNPKFYCMEEDSIISDSQSLPNLLSKADHNNIPHCDMFLSDVIVYIYTSGTTGFPKPAKITLSKMFGLVISAKFGIGVSEDDVIYSPLPLYHMAATTMVISSCLLGVTTVMRTKFSASSYISDCQKHGVTIGQYIGELLRYILNTDVVPGEKNHKLKKLTGNGVRADVWRKIVKRFDIPQIVEYYGSTEGNFLLMNNRNIVGSIGYLPIGIPGYHKLGPSIIKVDEEGEILRNEKGLCSLANPDEPGLLIGLCPPGNAIRKFHGYISDKETEKKIIQNVFEDGDLAFNTGDLAIMDERGWLTFVDRLGDTFRWKGENVSTAEVEQILNNSPLVTDSAVYGVKVGSLEGKAGMAAIVMKNSDLETLQRHVEANLPKYAQPVFLRLVDSLQITSTFKIVKSQLTKQAYDITTVTDPLFVLINGKYTSIDKDVYEKLQNGSIKM